MAKLLIVSEAYFEVVCKDELIKEFDDGNISADLLAYNSESGIMSKISEASYVSLIFKGEDKDLI